MAERTGPTPLPEVSSARGKVLSALATHEDGGPPATIAELAESLGGHPNTTRAHLGRLVDDGLVERVGIESGARGRPAHGHRLTQRGRLALEAARDARPVSTDELVLAMAEHLATTPDAELHARAIGRHWAAQLADEDATAGAPLDQVVSLLTTAGFSPEVDATGDVALRTCPVLRSAREHPEVVCTMHAEMLRATLERSGGGDIEVGLVPFAREGACLVRLTSAAGQPLDQVGSVDR
ncbi:helix-turn-helix domain-containing protein [Terrabacter koreensis]